MIDWSAADDFEEVEPEEWETWPLGEYRILNDDGTVVATGRVERHGHETRFDPPPRIGTGQRLRWNI